MPKKAFFLCEWSYARGLILSASLVGFANVQVEAKETAMTSQVGSDEEAFLIRRIAEFWKDGDFAIVKPQINDFLDRYPDSEHADYFCGILGDIYLQENDYQKALSTYQMVDDKEVNEIILINKLQCYYELDQYEALVADGRPFLASRVPEIVDRKDEFYFLLGEAFFRQALKEEKPSTRDTLAREAREFYEYLPSGHYEEVAEFALAEIGAMLGEYEKAALAYDELAVKHPQMAEDLLFQKALLEAKYNKLGAAETFRKVKELEGEKASEATFNLLVLLFQNEEYEEILSTYEDLVPHVSDEFIPTFNFMIGKSYFSCENYKNATEFLENYIQSTYIPSDQLKNALLIQMTCAHQTSNETLFSASFEQLDTLFPNDSEIPKALFMHAMMLKGEGKIAMADEKLKTIKENYPEFNDQETFLFESGLLAYQGGRWEESYDCFKKFVSKFDESSKVDGGWKLFLSSAINLYKERNEESSYTKSDFFTDLRAVFDHANYLSEEESKDYSLLYAKIAYELDYYTEALRALQDYIFVSAIEDEKREVLAEAHYIAGLCHAEGNSDPSAFCMHLEEAMTLNPELYDSPATHLQLYNAYISLAGFDKTNPPSNDKEQQTAFMNHAAEHLQEAISRGEMTIKEENILWLANHFYQKIAHSSQSELKHAEMANALDRASTHYQNLLTKDGSLIDITMSNLHLEFEVVNFAKTLEYQNAQTESLKLIKELLQQQSEKPQLNWSTQKEALYTLATLYNELGEKEKAYETYGFIHSQASHFPTSIACQASLEASRLHFSLLDEELRTESNEEMLSILCDLKELQIRKNALSEPTHLEAALEYAKIRSVISHPEEQDTRYLFFLGRMQDDFTCKEDLITQDYLVNLNRDNEKRQIFDSYMKFIEAEKLRLKAKKLNQSENLVEMEELHENALTLYNEIKNNPNTPSDLYDHAMSSIRDINATHAY